jgi:hypothetical protein
MTGKVSSAEGTLPLGLEGNPLLLDQAADWPALRPLSARLGRMNRTRAGPLGNWLAGFGGGGARQGLTLMEPSTGRELIELRPEETLIPDVTFSPDGHWMAAAEGTSLHIWLLGPVDALVEEACRRLTNVFSFTEQEKSVFFDSGPRVNCKDITYSAEHVGE